MVALHRHNLFLSAIVLLLDKSDAFAPPSAFTSHSRLWRLVYKSTAEPDDKHLKIGRLFGSEGGGADEGGGATAAGTATGTENDIRSLLNQCTIQSFMFLLRSTRDPHTIRWLDNFTQPIVDQADIDAWNAEMDFGNDSSDAKIDAAVPSELLRYHGIGAMNMTIFPTWDAFFRGLLRQNVTALTVETYDPHFPQFDIDIDPASLCSRILSVREQIAREFANDLGSIVEMGRDMYHSYWHQVEKMREEGLNQSEATNKGFDRQPLIFLEWHPYYDDGPAPSPLRKGNFDLLSLMCTQESIHRLIRDGVKVADESETQVRDNTLFLRVFYGERLHSHFAGNQRYGRADDFLEELFLETLARKDGKDDTSIDPLTIAEALFMEREQVALEWKDVASQCPEEHMEIRKLQLNKMMGL